MIEVSVKAGGRDIGSMQIFRICGCSSDSCSMDLSWQIEHDYVVKMKFRLGKPEIRTAFIRHRFGDEWPILVSKALEAIGTEGMQK